MDTKVRQARGFVGLGAAFAAIAFASALTLAEDAGGDGEKPADGDSPVITAPATTVSPEVQAAYTKQIQGIEDRYRNLLLTGQDDAAMKSIINQLNQAKKDGKWDEVKKLLDGYERPVASAGDVNAGAAAADQGQTTVTVEERKISYKSGNLLLSALVYMPSGGTEKGPYPGVLFVHNNFLGAGLAERNLAKAIAAKSYIVMVANLRGYGGNPGVVKFAVDEVDDTIAAIAALKGLENIDAAKIAAVGDRHGANCVLLAAAKLGNALPFVVAANPYPNIGDVLKKQVFRQILSQINVRINQAEKAEIIQRSPFYNVEGITAEVRLFYGTRNSVVTPEEMERYKAVLEARKVKVAEKDFVTAGESLFDQTEIVKTDMIKALEDKFRSKQQKSGATPRQRGTGSGHRGRTGGGQAP